MWPTFPLIRGLTPALEFVGAESGTDAGTTVTIPTPAGADTGDLQILAYTYTNTGTVTPPTVAIDGWRKYYHGSLANITGNKQGLFWRIIKDGDTDFTLTSGTPNYIAYDTVVIRNVRLSDPISARIRQFDWTYGDSPSHSVASPYLQQAIGAAPVQHIDDLVYSLRTKYYVDGMFTVPSVGGKVVHSSNTSGEPAYSIGSILYRARQLNVENLTPTWTAGSGVTASSGPQSAFKYTLDTGVSFPSWRGCYADVTLEAGKRYALAVESHRGPASPLYTCLTYLLPSDGSEHGVAHSINAESVYGFSSDFATNPEENVIVNLRAFAGASGQHRACVTFQFVAPETGTYRMRISMIKDTELGVITSTDDTEAFNTDYYFGFRNAVMFEVGSEFALPLSTTWDGVDAELMTPANDYYDNSSARWPAEHIVVRSAKANRRQACRFVQPTMCSTYNLVDGNLESPRPLLYDGSPYYSAALSTHDVYIPPDQSRNSFYYELTLGGNTTYLASDTFVVGVSRESTYQHETDRFNVGTLTGAFTYSGAGNIYSDGSTEDTGLTTFQDGDIVGVHLDLANNRVNFYLNGVLEGYSTIPAGKELEIFKAMATSSNSTIRNQDVSWTANFTGPFGGRKPTGAVAFDFTNEVT